MDGVHELQVLLVDIPTAARALSVSRAKLYALMDGGAIASVKIGTRRLIPVAALDAFVRGLQAPAGVQER